MRSINQVNNVLKGIIENKKEVFTNDKKKPGTPIRQFQESSNRNHKVVEPIKSY